MRSSDTCFVWRVSTHTALNEESRRVRKEEISGGYCGGVPPLPIPNREVKPTYADGTAMQCGRVGSRLLFKSKQSLKSNNTFEAFLCLSLLWFTYSIYCLEFCRLLVWLLRIPIHSTKELLNWSLSFCKVKLLTTLQLHRAYRWCKCSLLYI